MAKTEKELQDLKQEIDYLKEKLQNLSKEELEAVIGKIDCIENINLPHNMSEFLSLNSKEL